MRTLKTKIVIETYQSQPDLRITGSKIYTGKKAVFLHEGKSKRLKIYSCNTGKSLTFYIVYKNKKHNVFNDDHPFSLIYNHCNHVGWYIEITE